VFFIDEANRYNPVPKLGAYEATNPCGEQPLLSGADSCNLGSLNLAKLVRNGDLHWGEFVRYARLSTHFLDNVVDANAYPLPESRELAQSIRRIGNGVMGFSDALIQLGVRYDSDAGLEWAAMVASEFSKTCHAKSEQLAVTRGVFPEWSHSIWGDLAPTPRVHKRRLLRNCNVTTVAPTGTISIIAGCSSGIEPLFAVAFMRNQAGAMMPDVNQHFIALAQREGWYSAELMERIANTGHLNHAEVPDSARELFRVANDIAPEWHVRMQATWQKHI